LNDQSPPFETPSSSGPSYPQAGLAVAPVAAASASTRIESSRAMQQVQAAVFMAKLYPRDINQAATRIMAACQRYSLAERAFYSYPRGGEKVTGATVRLAEVLAQNYGNLDFGVVELERLEGRSIAQSYCWDIETNVRQAKTFEVAHAIDLKGGKKKTLNDQRDIYELVANYGARRLRSCIFGIIPIDIREDAEKVCRATLAKGNGETMEQRIRKILFGFKSLGVNQEMIEARLGHKIDLTTGEELVDLVAIFNGIKEKQSKRSDFFDFPNDEDAPSDGKAGELTQKLREKAAAAQAAPKKEDDK
jgi:hypothetical protein